MTEPSDSGTPDPTPETTAAIGETMEQFGQINETHKPLVVKARSLESRLITATAILWKARDYLLNKAARHDLNWREAHAIIEEMDGPQK